MTYLPSLIKKIDDYCRWSEDFRTINRFAAEPWVSPDDPEEANNEVENFPPHFEELQAAARQVDDPELAQQLEMLAELYRYSIQMGGGYATIAKAINNLKNLYSDGSDSGIEFILNGMIKELAKAAGGINALSGKDNPSFVQRLAQLKNDIESRSQEGLSEALDSYREEISGQGKGVQTEESPEDLAQAGLTAEQADIINPAALGFASKDDPKTNKGWHTVGSAQAYKDWKKYYNDEKIAYEADLVNESNTKNRETLERLIQLLPIISNKTQEALDLSNALRSDVANPQDEARMRENLDAMRQELTRLKYERRVLKNRIRTSQLDKNKQKLSEEAQDLTDRLKSADPERREKARREMILINQKLALNDLSQSNEVYKAKKRNYMLEMIRQMSGGAWPSQDWIAKQQQKIDDAQTIPRDVYDRAITEERGAQQARKETPEYKPTRGGLRVRMEQLPEEQQINLEKASFSALVYQFQIDIASATQAARQIIYEVKDKSGKKKVVTEYKSIIDEISEAIRKKDRQTLYNAKNKLSEAVNNSMAKKAQHLKGYIEVIRLEPHFRKVLESIKEVTKNKKGMPPKLDEAGNLLITNFSDEDKVALATILGDVHRLRILDKLKPSLDPRFKKVISDMGRIETYLALNLHVQRPERKKLSPERSPILKDISKKQKEELEKKLKMSALDYTMHLIRISQIVNPENVIDKTTADRIALEIFDKIYDEAYQNMLNEAQS